MFSRRFLPVRWSNWSAVWIAGLVIVGGCSREEFQEAIETAKTKTQEIAAPAVAQVEAALPETGSVTLDMATPTEPIKRADLNLISVGDGRPNVVQILTYDPTQRTRTYPSLLIQGTTAQSSAATLAGDVSCDVYYRATSVAPIAMTRPGRPAVVSFGPLDAEAGTIKATLGAVELIASDGKPVMIQGGSLLAVVRSEEQ